MAETYLRMLRFLKERYLGFRTYQNNLFSFIYFRGKDWQDGKNMLFHEYKTIKSLKGITEEIKY